MAAQGDNANSDGITRRDFLDGVAITAAGLAIAAAAPHLTGAQAAFAAGNGRPIGSSPPLPSGYYPPTVTGIRGISDDVVEATMAVDGPPNPDDIHSTRGGRGIRPRRVLDTGEIYDCVIVGAGASGLATAKYYRDRFGEQSRILLIDPLDDFGGHSRRNEFHVPTADDPVTILRTGGTVNLDSIGAWNRPASGLLDIPGEYGQPALDLLEYCGVDYRNFPTGTSSSIPGSYGLRAMLLFPEADWGTDNVQQNRINATEPNTAEGWTTFMNRLPFSQEAKNAIVAIQTDSTTDWITLRDGPMSVDEKIQLLTRITYKQYLREYVGAPEEAMIQYQRNSHSLLGAGIQAVSAADMWLLDLPGFDGLGLPDPEDLTFPGIGRTPQMGYMSNSGPSRLWPDGNISLFRLLVGKLIPNAIDDVDGARPNQENIVRARCRYDELDRPSNVVRIRLNSFVYEVKPGNPRANPRSEGYLADVEYLMGDTGYRVRGRHVVMACWNRVTAQIVKGLPRQQVENLCYARKVPLIYGRAALKNWQAFADAQVSSITPRGNSLFWDSTTLQAGGRFGASYGPTPNTPDKPAWLNFNVVPSDPTRTPQLAAYESGRQKLLEMTFTDLEGALYDVIERTVNKLGGDFQPERDLSGIMINRWNYGYSHELTSVWDPSAYGAVAQQPHVLGRVPFRNIAIANADSGAMAYTHSAISEGFRAVNDLPE